MREKLIKRKKLRTRVRVPHATRHVWWFALTAGLVVPLRAAEVDASKLPPPATVQVDFARDIKPIFQESCLKCHGPEKPKGRFSLISRESTLRGGNNNADDIVPGDSAKSLMIHYVARLVPDLEMPPEGKGEPLTAEQVGLLRAWIDQGAAWEQTEPDPKVQLTFSPTLQWLSVDGDSAKFRELNWMRDGWNGGAEQFQLEDHLGEDSRLTLQGHALLDDYRTTLTLEKTDFGFARFGWEQNRKYYDDSGGYFPGFNPSEFSLNRDLHLDWGRAWADFGLTLPDWPRLVLGYEYQYRDGEKSTLQWGPVTQGGETRNIYPNAKQIDEHTHIIKLDVDYEIRGVRIEDRFRGEFGELNTARRNVTSYSIGSPNPPDIDVIREKYEHFEGANMFRVERHFNDWLFGSLGYLYSKLDADAAFDLTPEVVSSRPDAFRWVARDIVLEQESHVLNLSSQLGPFDGLTISGGVLSEWMRQDGFGTANFDSFFFPDNSTNAFVALDQNLDRGVVEEKVAVRYTTIPFTVLFAEARLQQECIGESQEQAGGESGGSLGFLRRTDVTGDLRDFRGGFSASPWRWGSLNAHYRHFQKETDYDHSLDDFQFVSPPVSFTYPGEGYPAFIRSLERDTDEVEAKLALHPWNWLRATLSYKLTATDYETTTDTVPKAPDSFSRTDSRDFDAQAFGVNLTITPWRRFYLSTTFLYQPSRTLTLSDTNRAVVPFEGELFTVLSSANFAVNPNTDLRATYALSLADYGQNNFTEGLPLGINYQQHGLRVSLSRRINKNLATTLQYGFYNYDEPSGGGFNNYTAHAVFGTISLKLP